MTPTADRLAGAMGIRRTLIVGLLTGAASGIVVAFAYVAVAPAPSADVRRGSEEAFASGLHRRELPPGHPPQRWTTAQAEFRFARLPPGRPTWMSRRTAIEVR